MEPKPKTRNHLLFSFSFGVSLVSSLVFLFRSILMLVISLRLCSFACLCVSCLPSWRVVSDWLKRGVRVVWRLIHSDGFCVRAGAN